ADGQREHPGIALEFAVPGRLSDAQKLGLARVDIADDPAYGRLGLGLSFSGWRAASVAGRTPAAPAASSLVCRPRCRPQNILNVLLQERLKLLQPFLLRGIVLRQFLQ